MIKNHYVATGRSLTRRLGIITFIVVLLGSTIDEGLGQSIIEEPLQTGRTFASPPLETRLEEYPVIVPFPDGKLMAVLLNDDWMKGETEAVARYSTDNGHSWSERQPLFKLPTEPKGG